MSYILKDLSASALQEANEANQYAFTPFSQNWPDAEVYAGPEISWCVTDIPFPMCNPVFRARLKPEQADATIESLIAKARARNVFLQWWIGRDTQPADLGERLVAHGFIRRGEGAGMAVDLLAMKEDMPTLNSLSITEVEDSATLETWCRVTAAGFGMPPDTDRTLLKWFNTCMELRLAMKFYLGWWDGEPVATSQMFLAEGVAGIYFVATLPEARRRGIGFAITLKPLQEAQEMGYRVGILQASQLGEPVYRRIGFQEYGRTGSYIWTNETEGL